MASSALMAVGGFVFAGAAHAEPAPPEPALPMPGPVASSPPVQANFADGSTISLAGSQETQVTVPALSPDQISRDVIVGGLFTGALRGTSAPSGTMEVGYQVGCKTPNSTLFGILDQLRPGESNVAVSKQEFQGAAPKVEVREFRLRIDRCPGPAFIRSFAQITRAGSQTSEVVAYYGVPALILPVPPPT